MRILLVDDDPIARELLSVILAEQGLTDLTLAASSEEALDVVNAQEIPFDCFLLDIVMQKIDGIELCSRLRQRSEYKAAPIIMITSAQVSDYMDRAFEAGATDFLRKPLEKTDLTGRIRTAMLLVDSTRREREGRRALRSLLSYTSDYGLINVSNRICFPDAEGMLDYFEFENRLLRLSDGNFQAAIFRVDLKALLHKEKRQQSPNTIRIIHTVSKALGQIKPEKPLLYSYVGAGRFICCVLGRLSLGSASLQERLEWALRQALAQIEHLNATSCSVKITPINEQRIISKTAILDLIYTEYELASPSAFESLPDISAVEDNIFTKVSGVIDVES